MCGICGSVGVALNPGQLQFATSLLRHRGPDDAGYFQGDATALGMRRLSVLDLAGGSQPKTDESGTVQVVFNGEIYNYRELRRFLRAAGHTFTSRSDTEVIVHAYQEWGLDCFVRFNGIFAIALWDGRERRLILARDHLGVKPLYWSQHAQGFVFGSELKPVLALLGERPALDPVSVTLYLSLQYVPAPRSIFAEIHKLSPGHYLELRGGESIPRIRRYWDPLDATTRQQQDLSFHEAEELVDQELARAVRRQLVSEVPLGAFLSGGIDSSLVVAMMQRASAGTTKTFCIGFREAAHDESRYASQIAMHLGTEHHDVVISEQDALDVVPQLPWYFDEPFADPSAIPTYLVSQLARQHVTVALSGDGGDELFGGYKRYPRMQRLSAWWRLPGILRAPAAGVGLQLAHRIPGRAGTLLERVSDTLAQPTLGDAYRNFVSVNPDVRLAFIMSGQRVEGAQTDWPFERFAAQGLAEAMLLTDLVTYLPDDILTKVDRASMAHSLEVRVPLLDPRFVELALSLPVELRDRKTLLNTVLKRSVPAELIDRPKHGFGIPVHAWLRGALRERLVDYLAPALLRKHELLRPEAVEQMIREHLVGGLNWGYGLWPLLMFQMWYEGFYEGQIWQAPGEIAAQSSWDGETSSLSGGARHVLEGPDDAG